MIPYRQIDPEIRRLVRLMNELSGIATFASCADHEPGEEAYVWFSAKGQGAVARLLGRLPFLGTRAGFVEGRPWSQHIWVTCEAVRGSVRYALRVSGQPLSSQRECLGLDREGPHFFSRKASFLLHVCIWPQCGQPVALLTNVDFLNASGVASIPVGRGFLVAGQVIMIRAIGGLLLGCLLYSVHA